MRRLWSVLSHTLTALAVLGLTSIALGAPATLVQILNGSAVVSTTNGLPVTISAGAAVIGNVVSECAATTSAPRTITGSNYPCSMDVHGGARVLIMDSSGVAVDYTTAVPVILNDQYPSGAVRETATSGLVSNTSAVATLATAVGKTTYIEGFSCTPGSATAAAAVSVVLSGTITGSMTWTAYATNVTTFVPAPTQTTVLFNPAVPASTTNTTVVVTMGAVGSGGTTAVCNAWGYQL